MKPWLPIALTFALTGCAELAATVYCAPMVVLNPIQGPTFCKSLYDSTQDELETSCIMGDWEACDKLEELRNKEEGKNES